jgi:low affinity Fe/Cu permease
MAKQEGTRTLGERLEHFSEAATRWTGTTTAFIVAVTIIVVWAMLGPLFGYSNTWQLVINTGTTIITFLMVFLIQRTQNKDSMALQLKLNELVAAIQGASNRLIDIESLSEAELVALHRHYAELAKLAATESDLTQSHSVEEARRRHTDKLGQGR